MGFCLRGHRRAGRRGQGGGFGGTHRSLHVMAGLDPAILFAAVAPIVECCAASRDSRGLWCMGS
jgi:hypothetical protein